MAMAHECKNARVVYVLLACVSFACGGDHPADRLHASSPTHDARAPMDAATDASRTDASASARSTDASVINQDARVEAADSGAQRANGGAQPADSGAQPVAPPTPSHPGATAPPSWLIKSGDSVFFVGNSLFGWDDRKLPDWVAAVGQAMTPPVTINTGSHIQFGNQPLSWFFAQPQSQDAIMSGKYKVFVLQGEEFEPVRHKQDFQDAVRAYHAAVTQHGGRVVLFMTWDFPWAEPHFFESLAAAYEEIGAELDIPVIPIGLIYQDVNADLPPGQDKWFLIGGNLHQTESGSAVNAYATFAMLTGLNPMGVPFTVYGNTNPPELLRYLSDKSWARVLPRLHD